MSTCLLVGGAPSEHKGLRSVLEILSFDAIVAVDAGYQALRDQGIMPDFAVGDFDSLGYVPQDLKVCVFDTHKDFTDMDWALQWASKGAFDHIVLCDALDKRLDHSLGNLELMARGAYQGIRIWGISEDEAIITLTGSSGFGEVVFSPQARGTCSVIAHSDRVIGMNESGLEYDLVDAQVDNRSVWGISNELVGRQGRISLDQGSVWVFFPLDALLHVTYAGKSLV